MFVHKASLNEINRQVLISCVIFVLCVFGTLLFCFAHAILMTVKQNNLAEACEYGFGEESDLFKAPEPMIIEEPMLLATDPLSQEIAELSDLGSLQTDQQLIDKAFYDCEQDLLVKSAMESPLSEVLDIKNISLVTKLEDVIKSSTSSLVVSDVPVPKSVSSGNLSSMDMAQQHEDGMRRAFSESDIQVLCCALTCQIIIDISEKVVTFHCPKCLYIHHLWIFCFMTDTWD